MKPEDNPEGVFCFDFHQNEQYKYKKSMGREGRKRKMHQQKKENKVSVQCTNRETDFGFY